MKRPATRVSTDEERHVAALAKNPVGPAGLAVTPVFTAANAGGDTAPTGSGVFLLVKNTGSSATVTLGYPNKYDGDQTVTGRSFTIAATTGESVIPLRDIYKDPATGVAAITYTGAGTLTVAVVAVP
jgi:hypothetical protein